ncbi:MAG: lysophospholipase [Chloroflexi bacterium]|nr:MAG: lysophospholipase [Chloroflexota bacterium]TME88056.1 MAG: lysophospholipase [Chloroflexota bacterium]
MPPGRVQAVLAGQSGANSPRPPRGTCRYRRRVTALADGIIGSARTRDGLELRTLRWPAVGVARAHLLLIHGIAEHAGRHAHVASRFANAGIETHAFDLRGFGASAGRRAYVDRWSQYDDDVEDQLAAIRAEARGLPVVLYGHSMGGLIALGYVLADVPRPEPEILVLSAPAIASVGGWRRPLAAVLGRAVPRLEIANRLPAGGLSHDPVVEVAYRSDPLNVHRTTTRLGMELFREQARVQSRLARTGALPIPTYVLHGAEDPIVPVSSSASLERRANVTRRVYPGLRHEMHNEPEADAVIGDTITWTASSLG